MSHPSAALPRPSRVVEPHRRLPLSTRLCAAAGFALAVGLMVLLVSQQVAQERVRDYVRNHYGLNVDVPISGISPDLMTGPGKKGRTAPLGLCWRVDVETRLLTGSVYLNPWTHEVLDWSLDRP